jgi:hypothetical protein
MISAEALSIYDELRSLLGDSGFTWILNNVDELEHNGTAEDYSLERYRESSDDENATRHARRESVIGMRPYTEQERLTLLLDEIERCIIQPIRIANTLPKHLSPSTQASVAIEIVDNNTNDTVFRVGASSSVGGIDVDELATAIDQIRSKL